MTRLLLRVAAVAAVALVVAAATQRGHEEGLPPAGSEMDVAALPAPARPAFVVPRAKLLDRDERVAWFAPVRHAVVARTRPTPEGAGLAAIAAVTPEGTTNIVRVISQRATSAGLWVRVELAALPNGRSGWVPRSSLGGLHVVHAHLIVDRERFTATLLVDGRRVFSTQVGVGMPSSPTPAGTFYVRDRLSGFGDPFYGPLAFGTNARSAQLTDWPGGGFIGIHGTNEPQLIPGRISHGCIRMRNDDILRLGRLMPVGTPVTIT
jgi:L,D-transpeptidase catalytic domain